MLKKSEKLHSKSKGRSLLSYGMDLVKNELTTIEEVERVCLLNDSPNKSQ